MVARLCAIHLSPFTKRRSAKGFANKSPGTRHCRTQKSMGTNQEKFSAQKIHCHLFFHQHGCANADSNCATVRPAQLKTKNS